MSGTTVRIGLIGAGAIAQNHHLPAYQKLQQEGLVDIVAVADVDEARVKAVGQQFDVPAVYTDYRDLLALDRIDAVSVCTPNFLHKSVSIDCLEAGKHVLVEKPLALNAVEGAAMVDACKRTGKKLQVGFCMRFGVGPRAIKRFIDDGRLGQIYHVRCHALRRRGIPGWGLFTQKDKQGGGPLIDIAVHILDLALWMLDFPEPATVSGQTYAKFGRREGVVGLLGQWDPGKFTVEDYAVGLVRFKNGASLVLESSFAANIEKNEFCAHLIGTEGGALFNPAEPGEMKVFREESGVLTDTSPFGLKQTPWHETQIRSFVDAVRTDTPVEVPGEQALMVSRLLDAVYESSESGKEVTF